MTPPTPLPHMLGSNGVPRPPLNTVWRSRSASSKLKEEREARGAAAAPQKGLPGPVCSLLPQAEPRGAEEEFRTCSAGKIGCPDTAATARAGGTRLILRHLSTKTSI